MTNVHSVKISHAANGVTHGFIQKIPNDPTRLLSQESSCLINSKLNNNLMKMTHLDTSRVSDLCANKLDIEEQN